MDNFSNTPELRQDLVTGDWVIIASNRNKKPGDLIKKRKEKRMPTPKSVCPFENPLKSGNPAPSYVWPDLKHWKTQIFENKFPALLSSLEKNESEMKDALYFSCPAYGYHDLIVTKSHTANFSKLKKDEALNVFMAAAERFKFYKKDKKTAYGLLFHNWGSSAGASIFHPHYQLIALPLIPETARHSFSGSEKFFKKTGHCAYCSVIDLEQKEKKRIVFENKGAIAFTRFASKEPFDIRVFPKNHFSSFEETPASVLSSVVEALQFSLSRLEKTLNDPDYNFYLHSAPFKNQNEFGFYHWHFDIVPKFSVSAGMEIGSGIEITVVSPEDAAGILKK
ncbi:MAG: HIT domain-containing protein [Candidatus Pacebacteria bacterium]|nr:HIT domain-containing protein [Candidatus Paceibacterota bacterium]